MKNVKIAAISAVTTLLILGCAQPQEIGKEHYAAKNYPAAIEAYKLANAEEPNQPATLKGLAEAYFANRQYPEAIEWYLKARGVNPYDTSMGCNLGMAYYYTGRYEEALATLQSANIDTMGSVSDPRNARLRAFRGGTAAVSPCLQTLEALYDKTGRYDIAIANVKKKIDADPRQGEAFLKLADLYVKNAQFDEAIVAAKRAIDLMPQSANAHHLLGASYWKKKRYPDAIGSLLHARELNPKNVVTTVLLAKSYEQVGEEAKAIEVLRRGEIDARASRAATPVQQNSKNLMMAAILGKTATQMGGEATAPSKVTTQITYPHSGGDTELVSVSVEFELARLLYRSGQYAESLEHTMSLVETMTIIGIGIAFETFGANPVVQNVEKNSPAERAGIRVGDQLVRADLQPLLGLSGDAVLQKLRGGANTPLTLTLLRGSETMEKQLVRETFVTAKAAPMLALRALTYRKLGKLNESLEDARKAYALDPKEGALAMAAAAFDRGDMAGTLRYASALKDDPHAKLLEAAVYARGGNGAKALDLLREVAVQGVDERDIPLREARQELLRILSGIAKERQSKGAEFEKALQPSAALEAYAEALLLAQDEEEARAVRSAMFALANGSNTPLPEKAHRHIVRGEFFVAEANFQEALSEFRKALVIAPYTVRLYFNVALVEAKLERYGDALRHMGIYLDAAPDAPDARAAKDEMIKWEILMNKPKEYPYYEGSGEDAAAAGTLTPAPASGRGGMPVR